MSEKNIETLIHNFLDAYMKLDVDGTLSFFAENAVWQVPDGVFKGKEEMKRYLNWVFKMNPQIKFRDAGIGLVVKDNKAVYEYMLEAVTSEGMKYETPGVRTYEISDGKIKQHNLLLDHVNFYGKKDIHVILMKLLRLMK